MSANDISFKQVPRQKLAETVSQQLLEAVRDKEPGTQLPSERALVEQLGVGRSTVREALKGLAMIGVVEIRHGQGVFVAAHHPNAPGAVGFESVEASKHIEARNIVEPELARLAAARRTEADVEALEEILDGHRKALETGTPPLLEASRFHIHLAEAAHNPVLAAVVLPFFRHALEKGPKLYELDPEYEAWELQQHMGIFEAVRDQNPALALERTREHVGSMGQHYEQDLKRQAE
jgi:GntR family transcriptional regulator, transcriptional repressor for pyruvate dehydrogenase complex